MKSKTINPVLIPFYKATCKVVGVDIKENKRDLYTYVYGRAVFFKVAKEIIPNITLYDLGAVVDKDHAAVINAKKKTKETYINCGIFNKILEDVYCLTVPVYQKKMERLQAENLRLKKEVEKLKSQLYSSSEDKEITELLTHLSKEKKQEAINYRLKPFLKMNGVRV